MLSFAHAGTAIASAFIASLVEAVEALTIVLAVGTVRGWRPALAGCALVAFVGCAVHRPLARIPENTLKFAVGVLLSAFGAFWIGEGLGFRWPGEDLAILGIAVLFLAAASAAALLARRESAG